MKSSTQRAKEERAEEAAKIAASELSDVNKERSTVGHEPQQEQTSTGVIGNFFRSAKEAITGKTHETTTSAADKARKAKDMAMGKAAEYKDYAAEKAKEGVEKTKETASGAAEKAKDGDMQKAGEYKDYTDEKAKEGKDSGVGIIGGLKDKALGFFTTKKEEVKEKAYDNSQEKEKYADAEFEARKKMGELKLKEEGHEAEAMKRDAADRETAADR